MSLSIGIVGLPNVGKSTLFNALTNNKVLAANYPFATIEPNTGIVPVPDERLSKLQQLFPTSKVIPASVQFVDIAGLVKGAAEGEGLGNQFLGHIRSCASIAHVVRGFEDPNVVHVANRIHPKEDIEIINAELALADIQTVEKRLLAVSKETKANPKLNGIKNSLEKARDLLGQGILLSSQPELLEDLEDLQLITAKPIIYVFNVSESDLTDEKQQKELVDLVSPSPVVFVHAELEAQLSGLSHEDAKELLGAVGQQTSGLEKLINAAYGLLGLQSYLTAGEKEVRAWTIAKGSTAPQAAGVIHTDFERGFIAADVVNYDDLIECGSWANARSKGKVRTEGKDYIMKPNDVVEFKFNV